MLESFTLSNGIKVVTYTMHSLRSMHLKLSVKGGAIVEQHENNGVAHFMEHMLVQGIPSYPDAQTMSAYVESLAGNYSASTSQLLVSLGITVPFSHTSDAIRIASEVFFEPLFPKDALEKERRAVLNEIKQDIDSRWFKFQEFFRTTRFITDSPLQLRTGGTIDSVRKLTHQDLLDYWKMYFTPENSYLFLIGNLKTGQIRTVLEEHFGKYPRKEKTPTYPLLTKSDLTERQIAIRSDKDLQVNYIDLVFPSLSLTDDLLLRVQQNIALIILGRLRTSRLFQKLRYQRGLVYSVSSNDSQWPGVGYSFITSEVSDEHLDEVIMLIVAELAQFIQNGPTEEELSFTKNYLANSWLMSFDNPSSIADWVSREFLWKDIIRLPEDYIALLDTVNVQGIVGVMKQYWDMQKLQLIIQGPLEDNEANRKKYTEMIGVL